MEKHYLCHDKTPPENRFTEAQGGRDINVSASGFVSKNILDILSLIFNVSTDLLAFSQMQYLWLTWRYVYEFELLT